MRNKSPQKNYEYMQDCIHLKACRRLQKIVKGKYFGMQIGRGCTEDCTAYETVEELAEEEGYYSYDQVQRAIIGATRDASNGYTDNIVEDYL